MFGGLFLFWGEHLFKTVPGCRRGRFFLLFGFVSGGAALEKTKLGDKSPPSSEHWMRTNADALAGALPCIETPRRGIDAAGMMRFAGFCNTVSRTIYGFPPGVNISFTPCTIRARSCHETAKGAAGP